MSKKLRKYVVWAVLTGALHLTGAQDVLAGTSTTPLRTGHALYPAVFR